ncbi:MULTISPECIES: CopG family transcriptional regulator [Ramlibacter]|uniref:CopG family transcriptional regulator n=1 Tax=Ramlibacter aquaticus TaxID=2780094 RepID=A0ABR9SCC5_9BURK|nr:MULTISPECIES: CopG family transcriptional regulator [Ramlibacter]MBE7939996.1 CopG family transcriptional regulator [Ramlibacter aquaticus]
MKNVTVTMEDSVAEWARLEAARRNTSVSRLVGEMLAEKMRYDDLYERAMREVLEFKSLGCSDGRYPGREQTDDRGDPR